ncbi:hypothetical protein [Sulfuricurvum sp.]|uniref:hypothetical protein n=1 Tax=Sulfuricurvum sp. TaxID=2025608 RepID=UPI003C76B53C
MFEGIYFQFPKLGFLLFFFLACEALCPLRRNALYFPRTPMFGDVGVKSPLWLWIAKWAMITFLIVALMSPVRDRDIPRHGNGWDILLILDPSVIQPQTLTQITSLIDQRPNERLAFWIPDTAIVPLTYDHEALKSIVMQSEPREATQKVDRRISRFFATSEKEKRLAVILSNNPKSLVYALPVGVQTFIAAPRNEPDWSIKLRGEYPPFGVQPSRRSFDFYYVYPLFLGFLAMLAYLYGRNQKGIQ